MCMLVKVIKPLTKIGCATYAYLCIFVSFKDCPLGQYGDMCVRFCYCLDRQPCDSATGECLQPGCVDGWFGSSCDKRG